MKAHLTNLLHISRLLLVLSLILPTYNEAANIGNLLEVLDGVLVHVPHEIIVVDDDSPDRTWKVATEFSKLRGCIKVIRRTGRKGLSSAVVDGFDAAHGDMLAVMDADGQHDAALLLRLVHHLQHGADIAVGSRYAPGGSVGSWVADRRIISNVGTFFAKLLSQVRVSDPLGGFFVLRTSLYRTIRPKLHATGFKILLEILAAVPRTVRLVEEPLVFRMRLHGQSKLSFGVHLAFIAQVIRLFLRACVRRMRNGSLLLFSVLIILTASLLLPRLFAVRRLYTDAFVRTNVRLALETVAARQGWLLSDIEILSVSKSTLSVNHRSHLRTPMPRRSCTIDLVTHELICAE